MNTRAEKFHLVGAVRGPARRTFGRAHQVASAMSALCEGHRATRRALMCENRER